MFRALITQDSLPECKVGMAFPVNSAIHGNLTPLSAYRNVLTFRIRHYSNWGASFREFCGCTVLPPTSLTCFIFFLRRNELSRQQFSIYFFNSFFYHSYFCLFISLFITFFLRLFSLTFYIFECSNEAMGTTTDESEFDSLPRDLSLSHKVQAALGVVSPVPIGWEAG
jgi:hypothetical protein